MLGAIKQHLVAQLSEIRQAGTYKNEGVRLAPRGGTRNVELSLLPR